MLDDIKDFITNWNIPNGLWHMSTANIEKLKADSATFKINTNFDTTVRQTDQSLFMGVPFIASPAIPDDTIVVTQNSVVIRIIKLEKEEQQ